MTWVRELNQALDRGLLKAMMLRIEKLEERSDHICAECGQCIYCGHGDRCGYDEIEEARAECRE